MIGFTAGYYGFLGNQMFQYAAVRALAHRRGVRCAFPRNNPDLHETFMLDAAAVALGGPVSYKERSFTFDPAVLDLPNGVVLAGYFQSEKYFADCADLIRREFTFRGLHTAPPPKGTVSVHVRRGDYCKLRDHHPPLTLDYYREAMSRWPRGTPFMVFSDDPEWCDYHFDDWPNVRVMEKRSAAADMDLMSRCSGGHIIANSSFSWWGAWLRETPGKLVVAPCPYLWFGNAKKRCVAHVQRPVVECPACDAVNLSWDTRDLIPERWERI